MGERPKSFDSLLGDTHNYQSPKEETPFKERPRLPYEQDDEHNDKQKSDQGQKRTAVDRDQPEKDDKESDDGSEQPKEPKEEDGSVTVKRRKKGDNERAPRDKPKTKKRAANPENDSESTREKRRSLSSPLPASDVVPNAGDHSSGQLELSSSMVSEESGNDSQR